MGEARNRFVVTGLSRLAVRVADLLTERGAAVTVVVDDDEADPHLVARVRQLAGAELAGAEGDRAGSLAAARLAEADGLLALGDDDLDNLRTVATAASLAPTVPVVLRSFDAAVADQLEMTANVRRAYSVSGLAAPAFVAAVLGDEVVETLRLGHDEVPLVRLVVGAEGPLVGRRPDEVRATTAARVLARDRGRGDAAGWRAAVEPDDEPLAPGEGVLLGGPLVEVLAVALANDPVPDPGPAARASAHVRMLDDLEDRVARRGITGTLLPAVSLVLAALLVGGTLAFSLARDLPPLDALYFTITTAWGDPGVAGSSAWQQVFGLVLMVSVGALVGVLFSHLAAIATEERMLVRSQRRTARMHGHVIVAGLGTVGYRVVRLLRALGVESVAIDRDGDSRFVGAASAYGPVVIGDARLPEDLARAGVDRAACLLAATDDDLVNITASLQARASNPAIRTVARIFDDAIAGNAGSALGIDVVLSASQVAATAFVGAVLDERATRRIRLPGLDLVALRHPFPGGLPGTDVHAAWRAEGVHVVAVGPRGDEVVLCGPPDAPSLTALAEARSAG